MDSSTALEHARRILGEVPLIDGHNDFPYIIRGWFKNRIDAENLKSMPIGHTDMQRLRKGKLGGQFWSAYVPNPKDTPSGVLERLLETMQQIDLIHAMIRLYPEHMGFADSAEDVWTVFRSGRIACLIGLEGLHQIGNSFSVLRMLRRLGVRYITLTHVCDNEFVKAAKDEQEEPGITEKGVMLLKEMNRVGIILDLSHTSHEAQRQAMLLSKAPVIYSHSGSFSLRPHKRNVTDENLDLLKSKGGVIMIYFFRDFIDADPDTKNATLSRVVEHILYVGKRIGFEHVGIGSDYDGMLRGPDGLEDTSKYPDLVAMLLREGVTEEEVRNVIGLNVLRVLGAVERVSREMQDSDRSYVCDEFADVWDDEIQTMLREERKRIQNKGAQSEA